MGHSSGIFEKYYLTRRATHDVQNAFLGLPQEHRIHELAKRVFRNADPRVPKRLSSTDLLKLNADPELSLLNMLRTDLQNRLLTKREVRPSIPLSAKKAASVTRCLRKLPNGALLEGGGALKEHLTLEMRYEEVKRRQRNLRGRLERQELPKVKKRALEELAVRDISDQLRGRLPEAAPLQDDELDANSPRRTIALRLFCEPDGNISPGSSDVDIARRRTAVELLVAHCALQERRPARPDRWGCTEQSPQQRADLKEELALQDHDERGEQCLELKMGKLDCIFCAFQPWSSRADNNYTFASKQSLIRHADRVHFHHFSGDAESQCPHLKCPRELWYTAARLKNHIARVHGVELFTRRQG